MSELQKWEAYLMQICAQAGIPFGKIPLEHFAKFTTKLEVNKHLFEVELPQITKEEPLPEMTEALASFITKIGPQIGVGSERAKLADARVRQIQADARRKYTIYEQALQPLRQAHKAYEEAISYDFAAGLAVDLAKIEAGGKWRLLNVDELSACLEYETINDILCSHNDALGKTNRVVNFGKMKARYYPMLARIEVLAAPGAPIIGSTIHPHVQSRGVCWGNAQETYLKAMKLAEPSPALEALWIILSNYNPDSPYRTLLDFENAQKRQQANAGYFLDPHEMDDEGRHVRGFRDSRRVFVSRTYLESILGSFTRSIWGYEQMRADLMPDGDTYAYPLNVMLLATNTYTERDADEDEGEDPDDGPYFDHEVTRDEGGDVYLEIPESYMNDFGLSYDDTMYLRIPPQYYVRR